MTHSPTKQYLFETNDRYGEPLSLRTINLIGANEEITSDDQFLSYTSEDWKRIDLLNKTTLKELSLLKNRMLGKEVHYVNYTPRPIKLPNGDTVWPRYPRPEVTSSQANYDDNFLASVSLGGIANLPPIVKGCVYIVTPEVLLACPSREDFFTPVYLNDGKRRTWKTPLPVEGLVRYLSTFEVVESKS
tara:strand:+ start:3553 stop:4116 length:564 start_codon:yes stop_codon:yes gene_type:complete